MLNPHPTQILGLVVAVAWAIASAQGVKGKLRTLLTIVGFMAVGLGVGFLIGSGSLAVRDNTAINLMILLAVISAIGSIFRNRQSQQRTVQRK
jgi:hypothetical protein